MKPRILFLCTTNSGRSQMAEGILRTLASDEFEVESAGVKPSFVHPLATKIMAEIGIDITDQRSKSVAEFIGREFDFVITLCDDYAKDVCPVFMGKAKERLHWNFADPAEAEGADTEVLSVFRKVRDQIKTRIENLVKEIKEIRS